MTLLTSYNRPHCNLYATSMRTRTTPPGRGQQVTSRPRTHSFFALLLLAGSAVSVLAQSGSDAFNFFAAAQPQGPGTASYLRMHQPLYLLDLCRQVKAGAVDRTTVAPLVGGNAVLDGLLARDLDALYDAMTAPQDTNSPSSATLWSQIMTNRGAAPPPRLELPAAVSFENIHTLDAPSQMIRVTAPVDGSLQASLPADSPFRILSMQTYDGLIIELPRVPGSKAYGKLKTDYSLSPRYARSQAPWIVPVQAGQDVDVEIGLPAGTAIPPQGLADMIIFGDPVQSLWTQSVNVTAQPTLPLDSVYVYMDFSKSGFTAIKPASWPWGYQLPLLVPVTLSNPYPPSTVKGIIKLLSGPQGLSMAAQNFTLTANSTLNLVLLLYIDSTSPAWQTEFNPQSFRIQATYHTVPLTATGTTTPSYGHFVLYPGSQNWSAHGNAGPIDCDQSMALYATGTLSFSSTCGNYNIFSGKAQVYIKLGNTQVGATAFGLSPYERQWANWSISTSTFQTNFLFWRAQPMIVTWNGCILC